MSSGGKKTSFLRRHSTGHQRVGASSAEPKYLATHYRDKDEGLRSAGHSWSSIQKLDEDRQLWRCFVPALCAGGHNGQ